MHKLTTTNETTYKLHVEYCTRRGIPPKSWDVFFAQLNSHFLPK